MIITEHTVLVTGTKTDPLAEPTIQGAKFAQLFFIRHAPAWTSLANLLGAVFGVAAHTVTVDAVTKLIPTLTPNGSDPTPCVLNGAGAECSALFFAQPGSEFLKVKWGAVPGRTFPDVTAAAAAVVPG
jgi:hypothetical protein